MLKDELCLSYEALLFLYHSDDYEISKVSQTNAQIRKWNEVSSFSLKWAASSRIENPDGHFVKIPHEGDGDHRGDTPNFMLTSCDCKCFSWIQAFMIISTKHCGPKYPNMVLMKSNMKRKITNHNSVASELFAEIFF